MCVLFASRRAIDYVRMATETSGAEQLAAKRTILIAVDDSDVRVPTLNPPPSRKDETHSYVIREATPGGVASTPYAECAVLILAMRPVIYDFGGYHLFGTPLSPQEIWLLLCHRLLYKITDFLLLPTLLSLESAAWAWAIGPTHSLYARATSSTIVSVWPFSAYTSRRVIKAR